MDIKVSSQGFEYGVKHFHCPEDGTASEIIQNALNLNSEQLSELFNLGAVYVNNQRVLLSEATLKADSLIRVHTKPRRYYVKYDWKNFIVMNHPDFIILNKPCGIPSHPSVDNIIENSLTQTQIALNSKLFICHRLDTTTEGLIVYGRHSDFVKKFNLQLQNKSITKKYVALVEKKQLSPIKPQRLIHYMEPSPRAPKKVSPIFHDQWDECEMIIESVQNPKNRELKDNCSILKINLITGRTHQIRAQLSEIGCPILGDYAYGSLIDWKRWEHTEHQIALKSCHIDFMHNSQRYDVSLEEDF